jgi:hypothetical protein
VVLFCFGDFAGAGLHIHAVQAIGIVAGDYPMGCKSRIVLVITPAALACQPRSPSTSTKRSDAPFNTVACSVNLTLGDISFLPSRFLAEPT